MTTALIIGGTSGVGLAVAEQLAGRGCTVHIAGRNAERVNRAEVSVNSASAGESRSNVRGHVLDAADGETVANLAASIPPIQHLVITLAGSGGAGPLASLQVGELRQAFEEKYWPTVTALRSALPYLAKDASVTLVGAITARTAMPGTAGIGSLNAAVEALVQPLAAELAPVRVNAVSPGYIDTPVVGWIRRRHEGGLLRTGRRELAHEAHCERLGGSRGDRAPGHEPQHHRHDHRN